MAIGIYLAIGFCGAVILGALTIWVRIHMELINQDQND